MKEAKGRSSALSGPERCKAGTPAPIPFPA